MDKVNFGYRMIHNAKVDEIYCEKLTRLLKHERVYVNFH